jgi:hypothetical protein
MHVDLEDSKLAADRVVSMDSIENLIHVPLAAVDENH